MLLCIDIGTSNFKAAVFNFKGERLGFASQSLLINGDSDRLEWESYDTQWIKAFEICKLKLEAQVSDLNDRIEAIVITGNGPTLVPVLEDDSAAEAKFWLDSSAEKYCKEVSKVTGGFVNAKFFLPKILKIKYEENELYNKTRHFLGCPEYLAYILTGKAFTVFPSDGFDRWFWNDDVLKKLELDTAKFPPFIRPGDTFGLFNGIPVISGGPDFYSAIIGAGITKPGQALDRTGSSEGINLCIQNKNENTLFMSYGHPIKPFWNLSAIINEAGIKIEQESMLQGFSDIEEFIANDKSKSILEKLCFSIKNIIENMEKSGETVEELRVTGGLSSNEYINMLKANITGKTIIELENKEAELLGCAIIGSCALNKYENYSEACAKLVKLKKIFKTAG